MEKDISQKSIDTLIIKDFYKNNSIEVQDALKRYELFYEQQNNLHRIDDENSNILTMEELLLLFNYRELEYMFSDKGREKIEQALKESNFSLEIKQQILDTLTSTKINENIINLSFVNRLQTQQKNKYNNKSTIEQRKKSI